MWRRIVLLFLLALSLPKRAPAQDSIGNLIARIDADSIAASMQFLQDFGTRYALADSRDSVANWITARFTRAGIESVAIDSFYRQGVWHKNVVATIPGTVYPSEYVIVGAHHDSYIWDGTDPYVFAPGADDNASGTAAVLEVARVLATSDVHPKRTIQFVTFAAEEMGLWGSADQAEKAAEVGKNIVLMLDNDMIGTNTRPAGAWAVKLDYYPNALYLRDFAAQLARRFTLLQPRAGTVEPVLDSYPFWDHGFPAAAFEEDEGSSHYHQSGDVVGTCDMRYIAEIARLDGALVMHMSENPARVTNLSILDVGDGRSLTIRWDYAENSEFREYRIGIGTRADEYDQLIALPGKEHTFGDLEAGRKYFAGVSVVNTDDLQGVVVEQSCLLKRNPNELRVDQISPNPFREQTVIGYYLPSTSEVSLKVYDVAGRLEATLVQEGMEAGLHSVTWDGKNDAGEKVASGLYWVRLESAGNARAMRCLLVK